MPSALTVITQAPTSYRSQSTAARLRKRSGIRPDRRVGEYDLVTGYMLMTDHGRGVHMRLIPMGSSYSYAGPGNRPQAPRRLLYVDNTGGAIFLCIEIAHNTRNPFNT